MEFDLGWPKQITYFLTAALALQNQSKPPKICLSCLFAAIKIAAELDKEQPRNLDYILSTNALTAFVLLKLGKAKEAHEFIVLAEKVLIRLIDLVLDGKIAPKLQAFLKRRAAAEQEFKLLQK